MHRAERQSILNKCMKFKMEGVEWNKLAVGQNSPRADDKGMPFSSSAIQELWAEVITSLMPKTQTTSGTVTMTAAVR